MRGEGSRSGSGGQQVRDEGRDETNRTSSELPMLEGWAGH